jgi:hypothetical protein
MLRQLKRCDQPGWFVGLQHERAVMTFGDGARNGKTESEAALITLPRLREPLEGFERERALVLGNARAMWSETEMATNAGPVRSITSALCAYLSALSIRFRSAQASASGRQT